MLIVGAGGHAKEVLDILINENDKHSIFFYDNTLEAPNKMLGLFNVIRDDAAAIECFKNNNSFSLGLGVPEMRQKLTERMIKLGGHLRSIDANTAIVSEYAKVEGDVMHQVFVGSNAIIGYGSLINTGAQIHHDVKIGLFTEISPKAVLLGKVKVGDFCQIGANATVLPKVKIGKNSIIGAGAVVTKDIPANSLAVGVPASIIKRKEI